MTSGLPPGVDLLGLASSFLLVIGLLAVLLFALKRMQGLSGGLSNVRQIKHLETMPAGARQKIVLLRVKDREILVGISAGAMVTLAEWRSTDTQEQGGSEMNEGLPGNAEGRSASSLDEVGSDAPNARSVSFAQVMSGLSSGPRPLPSASKALGFSNILTGLGTSLRRVLRRS
jgi:flagellar protein FliO/FliZ